MSWKLQGGPSGQGKVFVDIKVKVQSQYRPLLLKRNFQIAVNKNSSTTTWATLHHTSIVPTFPQVQPHGAAPEQDRRPGEPPAGDGRRPQEGPLAHMVHGILGRLLAQGRRRLLMLIIIMIMD